MYFNENQVKQRTFSQSSKISTQSQYLELELNDRMNKYEDLEKDNSFNISYYDNIEFNFYNGEDKSDLFNFDKTDKTRGNNLNNNKENEYQDFLNSNSSSKKFNNEQLLREERLEREIAKRFKGNFFKQEYIEFIKEEIQFRYFKDDININYKKNIINKNLENSVSFQIGLKKVIEILIIILLFVNVLIKCNILSFVFLLILIITYNLKFVNIHLMFMVSFIVLILLIIQYIVFTSNLSYITNPFIHKEIILNVNQIFHIPWYKDYRWSTFYSFGTNRYQIMSIWLDVAIVLILYFYLEYFSYTIFREEDKNLELKIVNKKYFKK
jgi:hypothetical protein